MGSIIKQKYNFCWLLVLFTFTVSTAAASVRPVMSIDLGSEFIKIAVVMPHRGIEIVLDEESNRKSRAIVAFQGEERYFASLAEATLLKSPEKAVGFLMHILGHKFDDPEVQLYRRRFPYYNLLKDETRGTVLFKIDEGLVYSPEEIMAMLLEKAKQYAEHFTKQEILDAVLTVPPFYNQAERRAVQTAAKLAGINLLQLISDNAAVALNFGLLRKDQFKSSKQYYMFYDMGSTSTVVTIVGYNLVKIKENKVPVLHTFLVDKPVKVSIPELRILGVGFDRSLGGLEFTLRLRAHLADTFNAQKKATLKVEANNKAMAKLYKEAERVKKVLSANTYFQAQIENLLDEQDLKASVTRNDFEQMCDDLFKRVTRPIDEALKSSKLTLSNITDVILMGGGTRVPKIQKLLMEHLGREELGKSINTDEAAALGAVYRAASYGKGFKVQNFNVQEGNIYPISVVHERQMVDVDNTVKYVMARHVLYERMFQYPGQKVMTFINVTGDFSFSTAYSDLHFLTDRDRKSFTSSIINRYSLTGLEKAVSKITAQTGPVVIQAHFSMNESGILIFDRVSEVTSPSHKNKLIDRETKSGSSSVSSTNEGQTGSSDDGGSKIEELHKENTGTTVEGVNDLVDQNEEFVGWTGQEGREETFEEERESVENGRQESTDANDEVLKQPQTVYAKDATVTGFISVQQDHLDVRDMSKQQVATAQQRLKDLQSADKARVELHSARNELESFIFDYQNKLSEGPHFECSTEMERTHMLELINNTYAWFYEQSAGAQTQDFREKLIFLKDESRNISMRAYEFVKRPLALDSLNKLLESIETMIPIIKDTINQPGSVFTEEEIQQLDSTIRATKKWKDKKVEAQQKLKPYEEPVLLTNQISKRAELIKDKIMPIYDKFQKVRSTVDSNEEKDDDTEETLSTHQDESIMTQHDESITTRQDEPITEENVKTEL